MCAATASCGKRPGTRRSPRLPPAWRGWGGDAMAAIAGDLCDAESMLALKELMAGRGVDTASIAARTAPSSRSLHARRGTCSTAPSPASRLPDAILIVGSNPRWEAAMVNARIRKRWLKGGLKVGYRRAAERSRLPGAGVSRRRAADPGGDRVGKPRLRQDPEGRASGRC